MQFFLQFFSPTDGGEIVKISRKKIEIGKLLIFSGAWKTICKKIFIEIFLYKKMDDSDDDIITQVVMNMCSILPEIIGTGYNTINKGSKPGKRPNKKRDRVAAAMLMLNDYFA